MSEITVIIPVFKVEDFLHRSIDSVLAQSYRDFDVILIDDGSPDGCGSICDAYALRDKRVHVIHQKNGGLSVARNAGIEWAFINSNSHWLTFVDSDDWVHPEYLEALHSVAKETKTDLAVCGFVRTNGEQLPTIHHCTTELWKPSDFYLEHLTNATVSWGKLVKKEYYKQIRFPEGKIHEDEYTSYRILFQLKEVAFIRQPLYAYYQNDNGIIRGKWTPACLDYLEALEIQIDYFEKHGFFIIAERRFFSLLKSNLYNQNKVLECEDLSKKDKYAYLYRLKKQLRHEIIKYRKYQWMPFRSNNWNKDIYSNAFSSIRIARKIWGKVKNILKGNAVTYYLGKKIKRIGWNRQYISFLIKYMWNIALKKYILLQTPLHGNLGDQAIAQAELQILNRLKIPFYEFPWSKGIETQCSKVTSHTKVILLHGGGYLGQLWPNEEQRIRASLQAFQNNKVIILPQTVYFDMETEEGLKFFEESKSFYSTHPDLTIFLREKYSFQFMNKYMPEVHVVLVPDVVMLLQRKNAKVKRTGVILCMRHDKEKTISESDYENLLEKINCFFEKCDMTDTVIPGNIDITKRTELLDTKLYEFSKSSLVITDRLHGMIFAAITETPCIVLNSLSHKIRGCYEWISDLDYIRFAETIDEVPLIIDELKNVKPHYNREKIEEAMKPLYETLLNVRE